MYPSHESEVRIDKWLEQGHVLGKGRDGFQIKLWTS